MYDDICNAFSYINTIYISKQCMWLLDLTDVFWALHNTCTRYNSIITTVFKKNAI